MANKWNAGTHAKITALMDTISAALASTLEIDFSDAPGFVVKLEVSPDGQSLRMTGHSEGVGQSNPFGVAAQEINGGLPRASAYKIDGSSMT